VLWVSTSHAGRKRVVVLDFDGPKAEKFHEDVVKLIKKSHTVVSTEKWNAAAEELDAGKVTEKNVKKIAKKLKLDGVITGKIDKRRDEYIIKLKLRSGTSGEILGNTVQTKADGPRLDGQAQRDIKDELVAQIDELESNRSGGGSDEADEDKPKKKKGDDVVEDKPKKSGFGRKSDEDKPKKADEDKPKKSDEDKPKKKQRDDDEATALATEDEDKPKRRKKSEDDEDKPKKKKKRSASAEDGEEDSVEEEADDEPGDAALNVSPGRRAIDAVVGLSFTARNLKFTYASDLGKVPPGYRQSIPVAGAIVDLTFYPLSFGHKKTDVTANIGLNVVYDQVLVINSRKRYLDGQGESQTAELTTKENRWLVGGVFRYPLGTGPKAPVVGGSLSFGKQSFAIQQQLPNMEPTDIPNVAYTMFTPAAFVKFPVTDQIILNLDAGFHAITNTGAIQTRAQYGAATVSGFEVELGADYMVTRTIFARAGVRYQRIGFTFKGDPMSQTHTRDTDPEQDVTGAQDSYFGGAATIGYVY
jgi:hypothetical protein